MSQHARQEGSMEWSGKNAAFGARKNKFNCYICPFLTVCVRQVTLPLGALVSPSNKQGSQLL